MSSCRQCGAMIDTEAFCTTCGTPTGLAAPVVPTSPVPPSAPPSAAGAPGAPWSAPVVPLDADVPAPSRRGRSRRRIAVAAAGTLAVVGVAGVAATTLWGSSAGASSPTDAVDDLMTSLAAEDPVGAVNALAPSELRFVRSLVDDAADASDGTGEVADRARENGIDIDPDDLIPGLDVQIDQLEYDEIELAPDVHRVEIRSLDVSWTFDPRALLDAVDVETLTDGAITREQLLDDLDELDTTSGSFDERDLEVDGVDPFLMAVKEDDGWYVSPAYTVLEYIRVLNDLPSADYSEPTVTGAASQAEAMETTIEAWANGDVDRIIEALPPSQYAALYAYRDALDELAGDGVTSTDVDATVQLDQVTTFDDERGTGVNIARGTIELQIDDGYSETTVRLEIDGACVDAAAESDDDQDDARFCLDDFGDYDGPFENGVPGIDRFWLVMREESGGWFVDPLGTIGSWITAVDSEALQDELQPYLDDLENGDTLDDPFGLQG